MSYSNPPKVCPKCRCQVYDPITGRGIVHDIEKCNVWINDDLQEPSNDETNYPSEL